MIFPGFEPFRVAVEDGVEIAGLRGGKGPALLLLHGHPQTRAIWHHIAPAFTDRFTVIAPDLRGYGDSSKPPGAPDHSTYAKRTMARDQVALLRALGFDNCQMVGHDRGGRVGQRLAIDHPQVVRRLVLLDIAPTLAMYEQTSMEFARAYWHWFFLIQPAPLPERLIGADPEFYFNHYLQRRGGPASPFAPEALAEYLRCGRDPAAIHAMCEDYRAAATIDLDHDRSDRAAGRKIACPLLVLWGARGVIARCFDPLAEWQRVANDVRGRAIPSGHYIPEEAPDELGRELADFLMDIQ